MKKIYDSFDDLKLKEFIIINISSLLVKVISEILTTMILSKVET